MNHRPLPSHWIQAFESFDKRRRFQMRKMKMAEHHNASPYQRLILLSFHSALLQPRQKLVGLLYEPTNHRPGDPSEDTTKLRHVTVVVNGRYTAIANNL